MYVRIVSNLTENLDNRDFTARFMEMVGLRQRLFREHKSTLLLLDGYDLISDHVLIYAKRTNQLIGYIRSVPLARCARYEIAFPMENIVRPRPEYHAAYA